MDGVTTLATSGGILRLKLNEDSEELLALRGSEIDFSVGMHTEGQRGLRWELLLDVLKVLIVGSGSGALENGLAVREGEHVSLVEKGIVH